MCGDMMIIGYELWGTELIWNKNGMPETEELSWQSPRVTEEDHREPKLG